MVIGVDLAAATFAIKCFSRQGNTHVGRTFKQPAKLAERVLAPGSASPSPGASTLSARFAGSLMLSNKCNFEHHWIVSSHVNHVRRAPDFCRNRTKWRSGQYDCVVIVKH